MKTPLACMVVALALFSVPFANAFQVSVTSRGKELKWPLSDVSYKVNPNSGPAGADAALSAAMATWSEVSGASFQFHHAGSSAVAEAANDGQNVCSFGTIDDEDTLAYNSWWFYPATGEIFESDIVFNTAFEWSTTGSSGKYDLQSVATHELGHALSLDDLYGSGDIEKTMYGRTSPCETKQRSLHADDMAGIVYLYPGKLPDLASHQPAGWSSPVVVSKVAGTADDDSTFNAEDTLYVDFALRNQGEGDVKQRFNCELNIDGKLKHTWTVEPPMNAGGLSQVLDYAIGSLRAGNHTIQIVMDSVSTVLEADESNNTVTKTITVLDAPARANLLPYRPSGWPERIVISKTAGTITDDAPFYTTDTLYVDWAVENGGQLDTAQRFFTELYVDNVLVKTWDRVLPLNVNDYMTFSDIPLGLLSAGTHAVRIKTDSTGNVAESAEDDNEYTKTFMVFSRVAAQRLTVGVRAELGPLPVSVSQTGVLSGRMFSGTLPEGLKIVVRDNALYVAGVPVKAGNHSLSIQPLVKSGGVTVTSGAVALDLEVVALEAKTTGSFNGWMSGGTRGPGLVQMTVSAMGKITGKLSVGGVNYAFSATAFDSATEGTLSVQVGLKSGKNVFPMQITVSPDGPATALLPDDPEASVILYRNRWRDAELSETPVPFIGYYTATLPGKDAYGSGYLAFTVDRAGNVKTAGKLADGTAVSLSGTLILDEGGHTFAVVCTSPSAYKGGSLFGLAEFVKPADGEVHLRLLDGVKFEWKSRNPSATDDYGVGFERTTGLAGGWYSKTANLYDHYRDYRLSVGTDTNAPLPALTVGSVRYGALCWDPSGVVLTPTLQSGVMTGLHASVAGNPTDADKDGSWDYSATNSVGLKISLNRPTGVFKGSFKAWIDYPDKQHISKSLSFEGALTPVREDSGDGIEGRGYFLWPDRSSTPAYPFKWSYDFLLLAK